MSDHDGGTILHKLKCTVLQPTLLKKKRDGEKRMVHLDNSGGDQLLALCIQRGGRLVEQKYGARP
jgi:hypothetical protein